MPFKLKLKRTRRYEISTKNQFMVGIYLLDNSFIECTLSSESTGRECLESIAQRMELAETCYFGLRYVTKKLLFHWVELDKPLKKQLEKYSQSTGHAPCLYFGVMFYVMGAHKIQDDTTRFHYYLQLKSDLVDGRLHCSVDQATRLGAYSLQAEYGDYEHDKHTVESLKEYPVLPRKMLKEGDMALLELLVNAYINLVGMHPVMAEIQYIKEVQLMDSYGTEYFLAKDGSQKELYLGISYVGIFARYLNVEAEQLVFFRWNEIARLNQNKKMFEIDTSKSSVQYQMEDTDTAKYVCKMSRRALKFYRSPKSSLSSSTTDIFVENSQSENLAYQDAPQVVLPPSDSSDLTESQTSLVYVQEQKNSQDIHQQAAVSEEQYRHSQQSLDTASQELSTHSQGSEGSLLINGGVYSAPNVAPNPQHADPYYASRVALLPAYRPSPDYDAIMRQRMVQQPTITSSHSLGTSQVYTHSQTTAYSQPEIRQHLPTYPSETQYVNAAAIRNYSHSVYASTFHEGHSHFGGGRGGSDRGTNLAVHPTYSSPELNTQGLTEQYHSTDNVLPESLAYSFRPPPPYPRASSSTPDLAVQTGAPPSSDAPDLLPSSHLPSGSGLTVQSRLDKSVENLHEMVPQSPHLPPHVTATDQDDTSSEHSYATFHAKESDDSSEEDTLRKKAQAEESAKSQIQIRFMAPKEAPPPSKTKEVATLRESFRRMMIARAGSLNSGKLQNPVMQRAITGMSPEAKLAGLDSGLPLTRLEEHVAGPLPGTKLPASAVRPKEHVMPLDVIPPPPPYPAHLAETGGMVMDTCDEVEGKVMTETRESDSDSIHCLDTSQLPSERTTGRCQQQPDVTITSDHLSEADAEAELSETESELDKSAPSQPHMGPLKLAAMNGLSLSRPFMLALMNDESRAPKDERRKMLESKISEGQVFSEFEEIPKKVTGLECSVARLECNESRNRFRDILPYDISRVKLSPRKDNPEGYVNASHIKLNAVDMEWWFIATQAPLEATCQDFWQMIWEQEVEVVAMLTAIAELGKQKCFPYWPQEPGPENKQTFGDFEVELQFTDDSLCYITSRIIVRHRSTNSGRQIWHLQYTDWPDHGCPDDIYGFLGFLDEIESVRRLAESEEGSGKKAPVVVHCSAGVGRTGVVILTMVMKWCLEHNNSVDLPRALSGIRKQRMHMVQTVGQYQFIHNTLIQYLKNTRLI